MTSPSTIPVSLALRARADGDRLLVDYEARNDGGVTVFGYDGAPGDAVEEYPDLSAHLGLFVRWVKPATVSIRRILGAPPPGRKVTKVVVPALSRLEPGQVRSVRFRLPLPLAEKSQFSPRYIGADRETRETSTLQLVVGYMVLPAGSTAEPFPANPAAWKVRGPHGPQVLATASFSIALRVRVRTDAAFYCP